MAERVSTSGVGSGTGSGNAVGLGGLGLRRTSGDDHLAADLARNALLIAGLWAAYATIRSVTEGSSVVALSNARQLAELQHRLGIGIEQEVQQLLDSTAVLFTANVYYLVHFPLTVLVLGMAFARSRQQVFRVLRNGLVAATGCAVVIHWAIPLAPPRMLPGYVDAAALVGPDPYTIPGSEGANQFAAMPSMHVAWAILVGWACWSMTGRRGLRVAAVAHPIVTCVVVVVTGHHFITDVAVGAFLAAGALVVLGVGRSVRAQPVAPSEVLSEVLAEPTGPASRVAGERREHRRSRCHGRSTTRLPVLVSRPADLASSTHAWSLTDGDRVKDRV